MSCPSVAVPAGRVPVGARRFIGKPTQEPFSPKHPLTRAFLAGAAGKLDIVCLIHRSRLPRLVGLYRLHILASPMGDSAAVGTPKHAFEYACSLKIVTINDVPHVVSATAAPGIQTYTTTLERIDHISVERVPADMRSVTLYGTTYMLMVTGDLYIYDMSGPPMLAATAGAYHFMDTGVFDNSTQVALLDPEGTLHVMNLVRTGHSTENHPEGSGDAP